jgi:tetratricopeptide (TPR) repeat protein
VPIIDQGIAQWGNSLHGQKCPTLLLAAASACYDFREHQTAISVLELCVKLEPENQAAHMLLANSYVALERSDLAISTLARSLALDPSCQDAKSLLLWCYTGLTDEQFEAITAFEKAF